MRNPWPETDFDYLTEWNPVNCYIVAVAETGNISRATQRLSLPQPALNRQIRALDKEIGQCYSNLSHISSAGLLVGGL